MRVDFWRSRVVIAAAALLVISACSSPENPQANLSAGESAMPVANAAGAAKHRRAVPKRKQRALAGAALTLAGNGINLNQFGTANGLLGQLFGFARDNARVHHDGTGSQPPCHDGVERSWSASGSGQMNQRIEFFYDDACTEPYMLVTLQTSFARSGIQGNGTQETWDENGNVVGYKTFSATYDWGSRSTPGSVQLEEASAPAPSASPSSQNGMTCLLHAATRIDCGSGNTIALPSASPAPAELGFTQTTTGTFVTPAPSPSPTPGSGSGSGSGSNAHGGFGGGWQGAPSGLQLSIQGAGYTGAPGSLALAPATPPAWAISGGTQVATLSGTATIGFGGFEHGHGGWHRNTAHWRHGRAPAPNALTSVDLTLDDTAAGLTATLKTLASGKLSGTVAANGSPSTPVATISVDLSGTGTITYSDGSTERVKDWIILN